MKKQLLSAALFKGKVYVQHENPDDLVSGCVLPKTNAILKPIILYKEHSAIYQILAVQSRSMSGFFLHIKNWVVVFSQRHIIERMFERKGAGIKTINADHPKYRTISLDDEKCKLYIKILESTMETTKIYLRPGLSLDELSAITNIPRHHFSNLLNVHMGKTFYQYVSEYRIREAISRIENDDNITVESLSYECGFNSKTSFNRYFKDATGSTPSEYRKVKMAWN